MFRRYLLVNCLSLTAFHARLNMNSESQFQRELVVAIFIKKMVFNFWYPNTELVVIKDCLETVA